MPEPYDLDMLQAYVEGDMSSEQRDAYEREVLASDASLRELVRDLLADREALRRLPDEAPDRELMPEATERAERAMLLGDPEDVPSLRITGNSADRRHVWTRRLVYSGVAAAVLLAAGAAFYSLQQMGVDDLEQWTDQPLASNRDTAASDSQAIKPTESAAASDRGGELQPEPSESLALRRDTAEGEADLDVPTAADPPVSPMADGSGGEGNRALESREPREPGPAVRGEASASDALSRAAPASAPAPAADASPSAALTERDEDSDDDPDPPALTAATASTSRSVAQRSELRAESEPGIKMRFRSEDPARTQRQMLAAARDLGLPVLEGDEPADAQADRKRKARRENQAARELGEAEVVEEFDQRVSTLQMVVLAPPEQVARELRRFEGTLIGETTPSDEATREARTGSKPEAVPQETPETQETLESQETKETQETVDAEPALSELSRRREQPAAEPHAAIENDKYHAAFDYVDYAEILLNSLPIDPAQPVDVEHMWQQRVTIVFEPAASEPTKRDPKTDAAAYESTPSQPTDPPGEQPSK
jgi:hypothetical protein